MTITRIRTLADAWHYWRGSLLVLWLFAFVLGFGYALFSSIAKSFDRLETQRLHLDELARKR